MFSFAQAARTALAALALGLSLLGPSSTASGVQGPLPRPSGPVVLTVTGSIANTNAPGAAEFDLAMLEALGIETLVTGTSWTDGPQVFDGVPASEVLDAVGASGAEIRAIALNDYVADIPMRMFEDFPVLLALRQNGVALTARDKGPIWIVFPRDDYPVLEDPRVDLKWVWQLKAIEIR